MKTVVVGGGQGCRAVLDLVFQRSLEALCPEIVGVVDLAPDAPGMIYAREHGLATFTRLEEALAIPDIELVIEVTGIDEVRDEIARIAPGIRIMDHRAARVFWDLDEMGRSLREELNRKTVLEGVIREDRRRLQEILDSLPDAVMVLDGEGRIERVNRRFEDVTGLSMEAVRGLECRRMNAAGGVSSVDCGGEACPRRRALETGRSLMVVEQHSCIPARCDGAECHYQINASPVGESRVVISSREVTEQVRLVRETEELARRARQILGAVHGIITITDLEGRYQFVNPAAQRFFGLGEKDAMGRTSRDLFSPDIARIMEENDGDVMRRGGRVSHEETLVLDDREFVLVTERILLKDYRDQPVGICRVARNVTESQKLQQELIESEKHAAVGKLAAGVAHELNNPLTGILAFSESLLESAPEDSPVREDLEVIMRETFRCRQIVRDLLDFSRQARPERRSIPIAHVVQSAIKLVYKQAAFQDVKFDIHFDDDEMLVFGDQNQLQQVFLNLIINARDAMNGRGVLSIRSRGVPERRRVVVEVEDDGCGIPPENLDKIFEPFFSTKGGRGNGLGLAAVRSIVDLHKGLITVESAEDRGSTFRVSLPAAVPAGPGARERAGADSSSRA